MFSGHCGTILNLVVYDTEYEIYVDKEEYHFVDSGTEPFNPPYVEDIDAIESWFKNDIEGHRFCPKCLTD